MKYSPQQRSSTRTASAATKMLHEFTLLKASDVCTDLAPIDERDRGVVIFTATNCLKWAHDPARPVVDGLENMTNDQVQC